MLRQVKNVDPARVVAHLSAIRYGLRTKWAHLLIFKDEIFANVSNLARKPYILLFDRTTSGRFGERDLLPTRTFALTRIKEGVIYSKLRGRCFRFSTSIERQLIELAGGKLTL